MGDYTLIIHGTGPHHNNHERDADQQARKLIKELRQAGHTVHHATITHGGHEHLHTHDAVKT